MFQRLIDFFRGIFAPKPAPIVEKPVEIKPIAPVVDKPVEKPEVSLEDKLRDRLVALWLIDVGQTETQGKNRSPMIDSINRAMGVPLGSPYCLTGLLMRGVRPLCKEFGLDEPKEMMTAGTQDFWFSCAPDKFKKAKPAKAMRGDIGIMRNRSQDGYGHAIGIRRNQEDPKQMKTVEYNTDGGGSRDGEGCFMLDRNQDGTLTKTYLGCVDVVAWILDANKDKNPQPVKDDNQEPRTAPLSWETNHPERAAWSRHLFSEVSKRWDKLSQATDMERFYPNWASLNQAQKMNTMCELFCWVSYFESSWDPKNQSVDVGLERDPRTWSVGLLQMSACDQESYGFSFGFTYEDMKDPLKNLTLGVAVMAHQVEKTKKIVLSRGVYWAVIKDGGKYERIDSIASRVKSFKVL